jgi:hypothetical protein
MAGDGDSIPRKAVKGAGSYEVKSEQFGGFCRAEGAETYERDDGSFSNTTLRK